MEESRTRRTRSARAPAALRSGAGPGSTRLARGRAGHCPAASSPAQTKRRTALRGEGVGAPHDRWVPVNTLIAAFGGRIGFPFLPAASQHRKVPLLWHLHPGRQKAGCKGKKQRSKQAWLRSTQLTRTNSPASGALPAFLTECHQFVSRVSRVLPCPLFHSPHSLLQNEKSLGLTLVNFSCGGHGTEEDNPCRRRVCVWYS